MNVEVLEKLALAVVCGGLIGLEREFSDKPAGLRTNILICAGSMLFTLASGFIAGERGDPGRIAAQVVTGVGFLGAGTILQSRGRVTGLTSAATIWAVAAIGVWIGLGQFDLAAQVTVCVIAVLWLLRIPEGHIGRPLEFGRLRVTMEDAPEILLRVAAVFRQYGTPLEGIDVSAAGKGRVTVGLRLSVSRRHRKEIVAALRAIEGVHSAEETIL